jgi:DNA-binding NarL/FixJ family response regulator
MSDQPQGDSLRILLVDDHALFRRGIREVIDAEEDMRVVAEAADGQEAVRRAAELRPDHLDVVLMDLDMPHLDGIATTQRLLASDPDLSVVILTVSTQDRDLFDAARLGAVGFLSKRLSGPAIVRALRDFRREGALPMSRTMAAKLLAHLRQAAAGGEQRSAVAASPEGPDTDQLTHREREVLELLATGARDREIAEQLTVAENTVKRHVQSILHKLGARSRTEVVARLRRGQL